MSEIQRYATCEKCFCLDMKEPEGEYVLFTDHEAAIEQVLADAKARIGRLAAPNGSYGEAEWGFLRGVTAALAALTQPQTEKMCPVCRNVGPPGYNCSECDGGGAATEKCPEDCDGFGQLIGDSDGPCPACSGLESDGGGAATAAGVADADLVRVGDFFGLPAFTHPDVKPGIVGIVSAGEVTATITGTAPQRPGDAIKKEES